MIEEAVYGEIARVFFRLAKEYGDSLTQMQSFEELAYELEVKFGNGWDIIQNNLDLIVPLWEVTVSSVGTTMRV